MTHIRVRAIEIGARGPFTSQRSVEFARVTLVFGYNETGKTVIVENLGQRLLGTKVSKSSDLFAEHRSELVGKSHSRVAFVVDDVEYSTNDTSLGAVLEKQGLSATDYLLRLLIVRAGATEIRRGERPFKDAAPFIEIFRSVFSREARWDGIEDCALTAAGATRGDLTAFDLGESAFVLEGGTRGAPGGARARLREALSKLSGLERIRKDFEEYAATGKARQIEADLAAAKAGVAAAKKQLEHWGTERTKAETLLAAHYDGRLMALGSTLTNPEPASLEDSYRALAELRSAESRGSALKDEIEKLGEPEEIAHWLQAALQNLAKSPGTPGRKWLSGVPLLAGIVIGLSVLSFVTASAGLHPVALALLLATVMAALFIPLAARTDSARARLQSRSLREEIRREFERKTGRKLTGDALEVALEAASNKYRDDAVKKSEKRESLNKETETADECRRDLTSVLRLRDATPTGDIESALAKMKGERYEESELRRRAGVLVGRLEERRKRLKADPMVDATGVSLEDGDEAGLEKGWRDAIDNVNDFNGKIEEVSTAVEQLEGDQREQGNRFIPITQRLSDLAIPIPKNPSMAELGRVIGDETDRAHMEVNKLAASLTALGLLHGVLERERGEEVDLFRRRLEDPALDHLVSAATSGNYVSFRIEKENGVDIAVVRTTEGDPVPFDLLSTGAMDQILIAVRAGVAQSVAGNRRLFLVLDDAFQHADWQRRPALVRTAFELANQGWQIIYLTMDNQIRALFEEEAQRAFPDHLEDFKVCPLE